MDRIEKIKQPPSLWPAFSVIAAQKRNRSQTAEIVQRQQQLSPGRQPKAGSFAPSVPYELKHCDPGKEIQDPAFPIRQIIQTDYKRNSQAL